VVYVVADMGGKLDSPLYGMFDARSEIAGARWRGSSTRPARWRVVHQAAGREPDASYSIKWDGEWQVTYETFRDMGIAYASA
jgi:hypothetical protein